MSIRYPDPQNPIVFPFLPRFLPIFMILKVS